MSSGACSSEHDMQIAADWDLPRGKLKPGKVGTKTPAGVAIAKFRSLLLQRYVSVWGVRVPSGRETWITFLYFRRIQMEWKGPPCLLKAVGIFRNLQSCIENLQLVENSEDAREHLVKRGNQQSLQQKSCAVKANERTPGRIAPCGGWISRSILMHRGVC